jgi:hypothetical protein
MQDETDYVKGTRNMYKILMENILQGEWTDMGE